MNDHNTIENFEEILKKNITRKPLLLYRATNIKNNHYIKPQDVLESVDSQINRIQLADGRGRIVKNKTLDKTRITRFLPVNQLPIYHSEPKQTTKFETQCVSDTQLICLIDDAEAQSASNGITQEFNSTFCHPNEENAITPSADLDKDSKRPVEADRFDTNADNYSVRHPANIDKDSTIFVESHELDLIFNDPSSEEVGNTLTNDATHSKQLREDDQLSHTQVDMHIDQKMKDNKKLNLRNVHSLQDLCASVLQENTCLVHAHPNNFDIEMSVKSNKLDDCVNNTDRIDSEKNIINNSNNIKIIDEDNYTIIFNDSMNIEMDEIRIPSPVLETNIKSKVPKLPLPLVVSLERFEEFERKVYPLISSNENMSTLKHLINSQLLGAELRLITDVEQKCQRSHTFEKSDDFKNCQNDEIETREEEKHREDEILFSSDEENDIIQREYSDMPQTAVLEMSFSEHANLLEDTMFVGFQTASNKSIKICSESFHKAQEIIQGDQIVNGSNFSLTEMVEICDEKFFNTNSDLNQQKMSTETKATELKPAIADQKTNSSTVNLNNPELCHAVVVPVTDFESNHNSAYYDGIVVQIPKNKQIVEFKTASNTKIRISDKAYSKVKQVFMDIDLDEKEIDQAKLKPILKQPKCKENVENELETMLLDQKICDDLIIKEFENVEMSLEGKEPNDSNQTGGNTNDFDGFKTASNKNILISNEAMSKMKNIFQDIDFGELIDNADKNFTGFKTANDKNIEISAQALAETKNIFQDIDKLDFGSNENVVNDFLIENLNQPTTSKEPSLGDKTANLKEINRTKIAISTSQNIFNGIIDSKTANDFCGKEVEPLKGFRTPSNVSDKDLKESFHKIKISGLQDVDTHDDNYNFYTNPKTNVEKDHGFINDELYPKRSSDNKGFHTRQVKIKNVMACNNLMKDFNLNSESNFTGFKTASNKNVSISKVAIEKCKKIFSDLDDIPAETFTEAENYSSINIVKNIELQTANNKKVEVSKTALEITTNMLNVNDINGNKEIESYNVFQTANHKNVEISKEALARTKTLSNGIRVSNYKERPFAGFQTASNKTVKITQAAIEKSKKLLNDIDFLDKDIQLCAVQTNAKSINVDDEFEISGNKESVPFAGFLTASKNKVAVSKEALEKSKALLNDIEGHEIKQAFTGFQTANKKKVVISEEDLAKSKQLFQDIDKDITDKNYFKNAKNVTQKNNEYNPKVSHKDNSSSDNVLRNINMAFETFADKTMINDKLHTHKRVKLDLDIDKDIAIDTQVANHFEVSLCTEDFHETPRENKRSGSPILPCPRAKKKRFATPYKTATIEKPKIIKTLNNTKQTNLKFDETYKTFKVYSLKDLANLGDLKRTERDPYISEFNLENILNFEFVNIRNDVTNTKVTIPELKTLFLDTVNRNLVPEGWLDIQMKLIIWKLLSYELKFPNLGVLCTVKNVAAQLKYRYDKELYNAERSALRKIFERDDVPTKTMVLCVAGIFIDGVSVHHVSSADNIELLLTDGWYFINATIDKMLAKLVYDRRIVIGCKIATSGAELVHCEQGMAPWEDTSAVRLKIFGNSTRPAKWDAKLGHAAAAILSHLSSVKVDGGKVCRLRVFVTRVYPLLYVEKFPDGSTVTRSERLEHLHQIRYESDRELMMERIHEEVQKELSEQESQESETEHSSDGRCYESGSQIARMMKMCKDPMELRAQLTTSQLKMLENHTSKYTEKLLQAIQTRIQDKLTPRNVVTLARGRVAAVERDGDRYVVAKGMMSIWKPNDAILDMFKEGAWIEAINVVPTAIRYSEIQISAGRQSVFRSTKGRIETQPYLDALKRKCLDISDVTQNPAMATDYNEIDTVGIVFLIEPNNRDFKSSHNFQNVYMADADKNMISVNFWGGIKKFGFENILEIGQVVSCTNLQKRAGNTRKNIPQFRVTEFSYFTKTPKSLEARERVEYLNKRLIGLNRRQFCEDCTVIKNNYTVIRCLKSNENESPYRNNFNNSDYNLVKNKMFIDSPLCPQTNKIEDPILNLTGLDFESTFKQCSQELSPKTLFRKKKVNERIAKLKMYGEPPPLSPISIINKSIKAKNSYKSPLINNIPKNNPDSTNNGLPDESRKTGLRDLSKETSPIISMKRSYVRPKNPVKLEFSETTEDKKNDLTDHFAEEFDGSPPLSLD